jgi:hypothetical protein
MMAESSPAKIPLPREIRRACKLPKDCQGFYDQKSKRYDRFVVYNSTDTRLGVATNIDGKWFYAKEVLC